MTAEEENRLRQENQALRETVSLLQEKLALQEEKLTLQEEQISSQQQQIAALTQQLQHLQARQQKDSHNSHLPPSSDRFQRQAKTRSLRKRSGKPAGGQQGHQGQTLRLVEEPDQVIVHEVQHCAHCQQDLRGQANLSCERRQVIDLPPKRAVVIEHQAQSKCCPRCGHLTQAAFPEDVCAPVQYGPAFGALAVYLVEQHLVPYARASEILQDLLGHSMSVGTIENVIGRCAKQLEPVEQLIKEALSQSAVMHQDETGFYLAGKREWLHVSCTTTLTHYAVHPQRGKAALEAIGILKRFAGTSVHDGWQSYFLYGCKHGLCNVHHLRELTFLEEVHQQGWATRMTTVLLDMKAAVAQARAAGQTSLPEAERAAWRARYQAVLQEGYQANPPDPPADPPKRGRRKQRAARNLLDRLSTHQEAVLAFLDDFAVPFDNSLAERDIRMVKVQQKISGCFRSAAGAQAFCRIRGYLSTLRKQGMQLLTALELALVGHPVLPSF
jgi:transposase